MSIRTTIEWGKKTIVCRYVINTSAQPLGCVQIDMDLIREFIRRWDANGNDIIAALNPSGRMIICKDGLEIDRKLNWGHRVNTTISWDELRKNLQ